ncbi:MAG TPA: RNA polymerase sigma factor [Mycobacteriales bacterium]|nr:RNA polymerase sigma factor [Mycobacteriales bacterium]
MSTAQDLPVPYGEPAVAPALRLVPSVPLDFDEAVRRIRPRLHRYAFRRLGDLHEAEELVQEGLLRAYSHRAQLLTEDDLAAWTTVVTGRLVIDRLRVRGRSTTMAEVPETSRVSRDTADVVVARDEARLALDALDAMHPRQAALLWAREVEGQSYDDLCARFDMTEPAVRSVLTRARKALRKEYATRGGTLPVGGLAVLAPWVAGLGWADRLRRVATRVSAPAALSAVGITALGGLVLSPLSVLPHPGGSSFRPATAVVTTPEPVVRGGDLQLPAAVTAAVTATAQQQTESPSRLDSLGQTVRKSTPCVNDSDSDDGHATTLVLPSATGGVSAGSSSCDGFQGTPGNSLWLNVPLPKNPLGVRQVGVTTNDLSCSTVVANPLITCSPESTQPGAPQ